MKPLTIREAAAYTGYTRAYIYRLVNQGKIPVYKPNGGRLVFAQEELEAYLFRKRRGANEEIAQQAEDILAKRKRK
jgi:excisionase family DNA binding protein